MSETELDALRQEIAQLRDELHELRPATAISRRHALRSAGVVAAGALAGGIATIASAGPAAAASGNFTGDPAVTADATTGSGITATSVSGPAITASTASQNNAAIVASNPNWFGVAGTGTMGVVGTAAAAGTAGVRGVADSTVSGSGGSFSGPNGVTVNGTSVTVQMQPAASGAPPSTQNSYTRGALVVDRISWLMSQRSLRRAFLIQKDRLGTTRPSSESEPRFLKIRVLIWVVSLDVRLPKRKSW
jgi:hypothetical protein